MNKVKCFACHKTGHYASQYLKKELEVSASAKVVEFTEKFEKEFSLMTCPSSSGCPVFEDTKVWFVDSGAPQHMTGTRSVFLSLSKIDSECYVDSGAGSRLAMKGVGSVRFQLESGGFPKVADVLFIPEMTVNLLSMLALEIDIFGVAFFYGRVFLYPEGATPDTTILLGVKHERLYKLLGQAVVGSTGFLDS
jgi:hypothetical protein